MRGLAAAAVLRGRVRAEEERVDAPALAEDHLHHLVVDGVQRRHVEEAAADARLVGRHRDAEAVLVQARDRLDRAGIGRHSAGDLMYWSLS